MIKNYFLVAFRHLKKQPAYSLLNILGLTIGIVSSLLIVLYLSQELSYDNYHEKGSRLYRVSSDISEPDNAFRWATSQLPLAKTLKEEFSEVENYTRVYPVGRLKFQQEDRFYLEESIFMADSTMFDLFTYDFVKGNPKTSLEAPNSIVLSESLSKKIFDSRDPIGQTLKTESMTYEVKGVYRDVPKESHLRPNALISINTNQRIHTSQSWGSFQMYSYILLNQGADEQVVEDKMQGIIDKYVAVIFDQFDITVKYELINVPKIHLYSDFEGEPEALGSITYIYVFSAVALFLILLASINYMNLSTARSMKRSLEVGVRKVLGAQRSGLIKQFLTESFLLTILSLFISLILLVIFVPVLNNQLGTRLELSALYSSSTLLVMAAILLITSLISGSYPAFFLSAFKPVSVLKGRGSAGTGNKLLRRFLVASQFALSIFMLVSTVIIYSQMQYLQSADLGFDKEAVVTIELDGQRQREKWPVLEQKLLQSSNIISATTTQSAPGTGFGKNVMSVETNDGSMEDYGIDLFTVDYEYFPSLGIEVKEGRNFSREYVTDTASAVIVNEAMVRRMNWTSGIGKKFRFPGDSSRTLRVVGVVADYHHQSLYNPIEAILFYPGFNNSTALVKIGGDIGASIATINTAWDSTFPGIPFEYSFLDAEFMEQYEADQLTGKLFLGFSVMMILIACLGLLGLASFIAEQRTKEISIRKVLGAEVSGLIGLLIKDFMLLVIIGAVPAFIAGYFFMDNWLQNFEYHVNINAFQFLIVLVIIMALTVIMTGYHALKAATSNPAGNLKSE
mgnify:CR=1 FL=1